MTAEEVDKACDELMALLDLAQNALEAGNEERAMELMKAALAFAQQLPKKVTP